MINLNPTGVHDLVIQRGEKTIEFYDFSMAHTHLNEEGQEYLHYGFGFGRAREATFGDKLAYIRDLGNLSGLEALPPFYAARHYMGSFGVWTLIAALAALIITQACISTIGSFGPTTSSRMDAFSPRLLDCGLKAMIGKGNRSADVIDAVKRNNAVYFCAGGGFGALISNSIISVEEIAFPELGCESIKKLVVKDFPLIVAVDSRGNSVFNR